MAVVQLAGYVAFIVASLVLGTRLVWLWRRTREWLELVIGAAFWLAGGLGYMAWLALGVLIAGDAAQMVAMLHKVLPQELEVRGIGEAVALCEEVVAEIEGIVFEVPADRAGAAAATMSRFGS
jgi:hypothetical protein